MDCFCMCCCTVGACLKFSKPSQGFRADVGHTAGVKIKYSTFLLSHCMYNFLVQTGHSRTRTKKIKSVKVYPILKYVQMAS